MHPLIYIVNCLEIVKEFLQGIRNEMPDGKQKQKLLEFLKHYAHTIENDFNLPIQAASESVSSLLWLDNLIIPASKDLKGIINVVVATLIEERERRQASILRNYTLRWNLPVRMERIAIMKKRLFLLLAFLVNTIQTECEKITENNECKNYVLNANSPDEQMTIDEYIEEIYIDIIDAAIAVDNDFSFCWHF